MQLKKLFFIYKEFKIFERKISIIWLLLIISIFIFILIQYKIPMCSFINLNNVATDYQIIQTKCGYGENGPRILCAVFTHKSVHKTTLPPVCIKNL